MNPTILVIEDNPMNLTLVRGVLHPVLIRLADDSAPGITSNDRARPR